MKENVAVFAQNPEAGDEHMLALSNYLELLLDHMDTQEADGVARDALRLCRETPDLRPDIAGAALLRCSQCALACGRLTEALGIATWARELMIGQGMRGSREELKSRSRMADALLALGRTREAHAKLTGAMEEAQANYPGDEVLLRQISERLARIR